MEIIASRQSLIIIGYGVQKHKYKLDYLDKDGTGVKAIETTQEIPKETNSKKVIVMTEVKSQATKTINVQYGKNLYGSSLESYL